jgi:hypothetical protein
MEASAAVEATQYNNDYQGNGQSVLLKAVKKSIQKTYRTSGSFGDGPTDSVHNHTVASGRAIALSPPGG